MSEEAPKKHSQFALYVAAILAAVGGFVSGYDTGAISGILAMSQFTDRFPTLNGNSYAQGLFVAAILLTAMLGSLLTGWVADKIGRKWTIMTGSFVYSFGIMFEIIGTNFGMMVAGRLIGGFGNGLLTNSVPLYHSEIAPPNIRGRLVCLFQLMITFGIVVGYFIDLGCSNIQSDMSWRTPFIVQLIFSLGLGSAMYWLPYSPRWLMDQGRTEESLQVLAKMRADGDINDPVVQKEYKQIHDEILLEHELEIRSYSELFKGTVLKRTLIGVFIQSAQQWTGINGLLYFAPSIFQSAGLSGTTNSLVATGVTGICNFAATFPAVFWIDRWGRKPTLISGAFIQALAMFVIGGIFQTQTSLVDGNLVMNSTSATNTVIAFIFIFTLAFAYSWGACGFIYPAEIFPMRVRAKATSLTTGANWLFAIVITFITPVIIAATSSGLYFLFGGCCIIMGAICFFIPETAGRTLEDMEIVFGDDPSIEKRAAMELGVDVKEFEEIAANHGK
ncbi:general substrate transporter [Umbelopsis sp. PMI_123]|nr:general substrate transporter [Umbelopsis sp. PMI_123]